MRIESSFDVGEEVYAIFQRTDTEKFYVDAMKFKIYRIIIFFDNYGGLDIKYLLKGPRYEECRENNVFISLKEALEACQILN